MSRSTRVALALAIAAMGALYTVLAMARFASVHNETFDLAFYARMSWGIVRGSFWDPILNAHLFGLHISPVLAPLGGLGALFGTVPTLLAAQGLACALTAWPIARIGARRLGATGAALGAFLWFAYPNIGHVATYEFHPGTLAVLPLAWALDCLDRAHARGLVAAVIAVVACREDLALCTALLGLTAAATTPTLRRTGLLIAASSLGYLAIFLLIVHPAHAPAEGSFVLHFGHLGTNFIGAAWTVVSEPSRLFGHLLAPQRLSYLLRVFGALALMPLLAPRWWLHVTPLLAINLASRFPDTVLLESHYLTAAIPALCVAALQVVPRDVDRLRQRLWVFPLLLAGGVGHALAGGTPLSLDFPRAAFEPDERTRAAQEILRAVRPGASVQAPYGLLPHLAERMTLAPPPPIDRNHDQVIIELTHRHRFRGSEDLTRTVEEPVVRDWLSRVDFGVERANDSFLLLSRGIDPRGAVAKRYLTDSPAEGPGLRIAACLEVRGAHLRPADLVLDLRAHGSCPRDLVLRLGVGHRPRRVDLLFEGLLSPVHLRAGDRALSPHSLSDEERARVLVHGLRVGALRQSGARPEHADPVAVSVPWLDEGVDFPAHGSPSP